MNYFKKKSKYKNEPEIVDGIRFPSKKEARRYRELKLLVRAGEIDNLRMQVEYDLIPKMKAPDGSAIRKTSYVADFVYIQDGTEVVEDVKGFKTEVYKLKKKLMYEKYGIWINEV